MPHEGDSWFTHGDKPEQRPPKLIRKKTPSKPKTLRECIKRNPKNIRLLGDTTISIYLYNYVYVYI